MTYNNQQVDQDALFNQKALEKELKEKDVDIKLAREDVSHYK